MGKKKKSKSKKKQFWGLPKEVRMVQAKSWLEKYDGEHIIKAYSKFFALNLKNALKELELVGAQISTQEREYTKELIKKRKQEKERKKEKRRIAKEQYEFEDYDDTFAFIAGYTAGSVPFGMTYEEMEEDII
ncbi:hypothetical protein QFZ31_003906 [Neobacillus niacini]|uniref:hypothetical protein n=1 Tax=Neobacillus driksii TaxID=3035913 RepID=UPI00277FFA99|nr:hypothetical protein [Neobacillus niacini]MDQ0974028.1 hypothetical protein [Neobacillus niacini]